MGVSNLKILPLNCGTIHIEKSTQIYWHKLVVKIDIPLFTFLILGGEKTILVDTSFLSVERAREYRHWPSSGAPDQELSYQFKKAGVEPREVELASSPTSIMTTHRTTGCFPRRNSSFGAMNCVTPLRLCPLRLSPMKRRCPRPIQARYVPQLARFSTSFPSTAPREV